MNPGELYRRMVEASSHEPLRDITRADRRALLVATATSALVWWADAVPSGIPLLGIRFESSNQIAIAQILAAIVAVLIATFVSHAWTDLERSWLLLREIDAIKAVHAAEGIEVGDRSWDPNPPTEEEVQQSRDVLRLEAHRAEQIVFNDLAGKIRRNRARQARLFWDVGFPVVAGLLAVVLLLVWEPVVEPAQAHTGFLGLDGAQEQIDGERQKPHPQDL